MDERTLELNKQAAPEFRRAIPEPQVRTRGYSKAGIAAALFLLLLIAAGTFQIVRWLQAPQQPTGRSVQGGPQSVTAATVGVNNVPVIVSALGTVAPIATVTVQSQISGYLMQVNFTEGQLVKQGDPLAQIDDRPYQALKAQYEGQLAHDQGLLNQAKRDFERYQKLQAQNSIATQQVEDQQYVVQQYQGTVAQDQALVRTQQLNIDYCNIRSPVTGRVGLRLVDAGNYVQSNSTTGLAVVTQLQPITVIFAVPEDTLPDIMPQYYAGTALQVTAFDRSNRRQVAQGRVSAVDSQIDTTTGTVKVRAQFENTDNALFPNQFVNVQLLVTTLQNAVTVPTQAIQRGAVINAADGSSSDGSGGASATANFVYVVEPNGGTVSARQVTVGPTFVASNNVSMTAVNTGLTAGERVVISGTDRLREGLHVRVTNLDGKDITGPAPPSSGGNPHHRGQPRQGSGDGSQ